MKDYNEILIRSCTNNDFLNVKFAINNGADVNYKNQESFFIAIENNNLQILKYLYKQIDFNYINDLFLLYAIKHSTLETFKYLFDLTNIIDIPKIFMSTINSNNKEKYEIIKYLYTTDIINHLHKNILYSALFKTSANLKESNISILLLDNYVEFDDKIIIQCINNNNTDLLKYIEKYEIDLKYDNNFYFEIAIDNYKKKRNNLEIIMYLLLNDAGNVNNIYDTELLKLVKIEFRKYKLNEILCDLK